MLLKINTVRLEATLLDGQKAVATIPFKTGCNLIVTPKNTRGKSSIINAIAVGLGLDHLVRKNVSALVKENLKIGDKELPIVESCIFLEIQNKNDEILTIKREIAPTFSNGMNIRRCALKDWSEDDLGTDCYIGYGSYKNQNGFHRMLSEFIDFPDIQVISYDDEHTKLYLEYIFSATFIEQKRGWVDIMSNSPNYKVKDPKKTTIAEILGMEYRENNLARNELKQELDTIKIKYETNLDSLRKTASSERFFLKGLPSDITANVWKPELYRIEDDNEIALNKVSDNVRSILEKKYEDSKDENAINLELEETLETISQEIAFLSSKRRELAEKERIKQNSIAKYKTRLKTLSDDLEKNKEERKIKDLFAKDSWSVSKKCPLCLNDIDETLRPQVGNFPAMDLDDNIKYVTQQIELQKQVIASEERELRFYSAELENASLSVSEHLSKQVQIQKSLSGHLPSGTMLIAREIAKLEKEVESFIELEEVSTEEFAKLEKLYKLYKNKKKTYDTLSSGLSENDKNKLFAFENTFRSFLQKLGYESYETKLFKIDGNKFTPIVEIFNENKTKKVDPDLGSSASDWIRIVTAYTLALHKKAISSDKSQHPHLTIFDEPQQQNMQTNDHLRFYELCAQTGKSGGQIIIAATDEDGEYEKKGKELNMNVISYDNYILEPIPQTNT